MVPWMRRRHVRNIRLTHCVIPGVPGTTGGYQQDRHLLLLAWARDVTAATGRRPAARLSVR